ncbi:unnamed protein product [Closterium sp. NIES-64]|nr:unnamed protein product [Closterium sp. NIES-64]
MLLMILATLLLAAQPSSANRRAWRNGGRFQPLEAPVSGGNGSNGGSGSVYIVRLSSAPPLVEYRGGIAGYPATATWDDGRDANDGADDDESVPEMDLAATDVAAGADAASLRAAKHEVEDATTPAPPRSAAAADDDAAPSRAVKLTVPLPYWDDDWSFFYSEPNATTPAPAGATGSGGDNGNGGRAARRRMRLSMDRPQVAAFATLLQRQQAQVASEAGILDSDLLYSYKHTSNGFAARLTARQVWRLQRHPDVASVTPSRMFSVQTTDSPKFLGLPGKVWPAVGGQSKAGDGIVVGIIDTGIWPEHPSFSDAGMSSKLPSGWKGKCEQSSSFRCNNKVIGARAFYAAFGSPSLQNDWLSPRDGNGHGTWCAGAAAGNPVSMQGGGQMSGMAPAARLAVYKVLWTDSEGRGGVDTGAVNQAVADGVDVLSLSLGGLVTNQNYFGDLVYLRANAARVFVAMAAGNEGAPGRLQGGIYRTVGNFSPFFLSIGASTIARGASLALAAGTQSLNPLNAIAGASASSNSTGDNNATLTADGGITFTAASAAPMVAEFSSRGPLVPPSDTASPPRPANDILKPDIIRPGVDLLAAFPSKKIGEPGTTARLSGASMATPHLAGLAAIIIQKFPNWTPAQVMSAMMTTARVTDTSNNPIKTKGSGAEATPWEMGAGHVFPPAMLDPGLTYDVREKDYQNFLAGQDLNRAKKEFPGVWWLFPLAVRNLNLPTITLPRLQGSVQVTRTVTCVGSSVSTYNVSGKAPPGVQLSVGPASFTLALGQKATYTVKITVETPSNDFKYGFIVWKDNKGHSVRSPLVVQPIPR